MAALRVALALLAAVDAAASAARRVSMHLPREGLGLTSSYEFEMLSPQEASASALPLVLMLSGFCLPADMQDNIQLRYADLVESHQFLYVPLRSAHIARTCALCPTTVRAADAMGNMPVYSATARLLEVTSAMGSCTAWDATSACCVPERAGRHGGDVPLIASVIKKVMSVTAVDERRIYVVGIANGGFMALRAACELGTQLAGVVAYASALYSHECAMTHGLPPLLLIHGSDDVVVPFNGGINSAGVPFPGFMEEQNIWAALDGCTGGIRNSSWIAKAGNNNPLNIEVQQYNGCDFESWKIIHGQHFALPDTSYVIFQKALTEFLMPRRSKMVPHF